MSKIINLEDFKKGKKIKENININNDNKQCQSEYINAFKKMTAEEIKMMDELLEN
ncbi:hypothetical protein [Clostridium tagluense]|uniref:hypothetical protein n=1 Tax=Clostridium tagluense TaxID=360422 RepID=UPI001C6EC42B|nr:hypothetical protein [Clostridium tagluense]MBW9156286.1 hypothetical protein [Clostridium tagluense]WLC64298.1 hypothetical protein KTC93_15660 [Clostridium tagluense]